MKKVTVLIGVLLCLAIVGYMAQARVVSGLPDEPTGNQAAGQASGPAPAADMELYMHIGSPVAFANGRLLSLDKDSPDLAPVVYKTRTLVPLRVIGEYFGAEVGYDPASARATIRTPEHEAIFPVGKNHYYLDGVERALDAETILISGRAFVPLREICQVVLNYTVDYRDDLIYVAKAARLTEESIRSVKSRIGMYVRAVDLETLNRYMGGRGDYSYRWEATDEEWVFSVSDVEVPLMVEKEASQANDAAPMAGSGAASAAPSAPPMPETGREPQPSVVQDSTATADAGYSTTNVQVEGVDEGDIIKTDGKYIYIIASQYLKVVDAASMTLAGEYFLGDNSSAQEMYIDKDRVTIIGSRYDWPNLKPEPRTGDVMMDIAPILPGGRYMSSNYTFVRVLDTSNMRDIKSFRYFEAEGSMTTSRKKGDYVYLVSGFYGWYRGGGGGDVRPLAGEGGTLAPMPIERIMIMPGGYGDGFLTVSAVNTRDTSEKVSGETIAGAGYVSYMSNDNLYIAVNDMRYSSTQNTNIARFAIDGGKIGYAGSCGVEGSLDNQFSMDEHKGHLRVAATVYWPRTYNNLFVLDANMDVAGKVAGYAEGERIYSARFMGDRGYVVTFRQVDPLFVFDLSDPAAPKITGELKVPGFSTYLHPVSQNVLLGVGRDVYDIYRTDRDGNQIVIGQNTGGVKISLFDVSDMGKPKEMDTLILGDYGYTELLDNHRAAMFKNSDSLFGFCGQAADNPGGDHFQGAFLISYAGGKLSEAGRVAHENPYAAYSRDEIMLYTGERLAYIGDTLYYLQDGMLRSFDFGSLTPKTSLRLTAGR
ncbi:MAG: beta-propeller domain-containing protein [Clostridiales bacterium]|nr:beta-propeller domain-containing protein [Clostridiales bacterium]